MRALLIFSVLLGTTAGAQALSSSFALLCNTSTFDWLANSDWRQRLEQDVMPTVLANAPYRLALHIMANEGEKDECPECRKELQCHLKMYALVGSLIASVAPHVLPPAARPPAAVRAAGGEFVATPDSLPALDEPTLARLQRLADILEGSLVPVIGFLWRNETAAALLASHTIMEWFGWAVRSHQEQDDPFVAAIPDGYGLCWNQLALHRARPDVFESQAGKLSGTVCSAAYLLNFGELRVAWQQHLDVFFQHSYEHSQPWTVEGNLQALTSTDTSTTVQWALPVQTFRDSGFISSPSKAKWARAEAPSFIAAGFVWYPNIDARGKNASIGVRLWQQHKPAADAAVRVNLTISMAHNASQRQGGRLSGSVNPGDWQTSFTCDWPGDFSWADTVPTCAQPVLPLWCSLTGKLPGFVADDELLLTFTLTLVPGSPDFANSSRECSGSVCASPQPALGPFAGSRPPLEGMALSMGYLSSLPQLWGQTGFPSKRLPATSAVAVRSRLHQLAAERNATNSWHFVRPVLRKWQGAKPEGLYAELMQAMRFINPPPSEHATGEDMFKAAGPWADAAAAAVFASFSACGVALLCCSLHRRIRRSAWRPLRVWILYQMQQLRTRRAQAGQQAARKQRRQGRPPRRGKQQRQGAQQLGKATSPAVQSPPQPSPATCRAATSTPKHELNSSSRRPQAAPVGNDSGALPIAPGSSIDAAACERSTAQAQQQQHQAGLAPTPLTASPGSETSPSQRRRRKQRQQECVQQLEGCAALPVACLEAAATQPEGSPGAPAAGTVQQAAAMPLAVPPCAAVGLAAPAPVTPEVAGQARLREQPGDAEAWPPPSLPAQAAASQPDPEAAPAAATLAEEVGGSGAGSEPAGQQQEGERECVVCWEQERQVVLVPCGHLILCRCCADGLLAKHEPLCPICRQPVVSAPTVFI